MPRTLGSSMDGRAVHTSYSAAGPNALLRFANAAKWPSGLADTSAFMESDLPRNAYLVDALRLTSGTMGGGQRVLRRNGFLDAVRSELHAAAGAEFKAGTRLGCPGPYYAPIPPCNIETRSPLSRSIGYACLGATCPRSSCSDLL
jgi:hypothetical protein